MIIGQQDLREEEATDTLKLFMGSRWNPLKLRMEPTLVNKDSWKVEYTHDDTNTGSIDFQHCNATAGVQVWTTIFSILADGSLVWGEKNTNGSWKLGKDGTELIVSHCEAGTYVEKFRFTL